MMKVMIIEIIIEDVKVLMTKTNNYWCVPGNFIHKSEGIAHG